MNAWQRYRWGDRWERGRPPGRSRPAAALIWFGFIVIPVVQAISDDRPPLGHALLIAATVAFSANYVWLVLTWFDSRSNWRPYALCGLMLALTIILNLADGSAWGYLFTYCSACAALVVAPPLGFPAVFVCTVLAVVCTLIGGASTGAAFGYGVSTVGVGLLLTLMRDLRMRNQELTEARAELARTAVAQERERFARDLHDLLGHSLSVIAIKAELARRLLPGDPERAATEVGEVEGVARQALAEVRDAVSGYRQPTLNGELRGARMALSAAGIEADVERETVAFDPDVEAVLAWAVREGATNVIRHSGARHCTLKVSSTPDGAAVEVLDDGAGSAAAAPGSASVGAFSPGAVSARGHDGNGLAGLSERAEGLRGRIEAGSLPGGGFRLVVSLPVSAP